MNDPEAQPAKAQVVNWSGSDSSYDLIVQVVDPRPPDSVEFDILGMDDNPRLLAFQTQARAFGTDLLQDCESAFGFRCVIAQRVPETFVWQARMRSALDKAMDPALDYDAPQWRVER